MGVKNGGLIPDIKMYSPLYEAGETRIAGPAFTVEVSVHPGSASGGRASRSLPPSVYSSQSYPGHSCRGQ